MTDRELMQQAFDAMSYGNTDEREAARLALRDRLAQPEQEPVAHYLLAALKSVLPELESVGPLDKFERALAAIALFERLAQPEQEPVTLRIDRLNQWLDASLKDCKPAREQPAQRKPLTDEEIGKIAGETLDPWSCARVIEAAHGIKENT